MKTILITGGAGFIGSNFIHFFLEKYKKYNIINLDSLTYAASVNNLSGCDKSERYKFIEGDIRDRALIEKIFQDNHISGVIHFAAESHVDNSISDPGIFIESNINGTFNLLDVAYKCWMNGPFKKNENFSEARFHHISTDEVFGSLGEQGLFTEQTPYAPNSPYSASKASSDFLVRSYFKTYGLNVTISNCSNNFGPRQNKEKLIPTIIRNCYEKNEIPIYGNGKNVRDWLYVDDHCKAIDLIFHSGLQGETYNVGGENELTNIKITEMICEIFDQIYSKNFLHKDLISFVKDRPGHDKRYAIDSTKIQNSLGWKPNHRLDLYLKKTVDWYLNEK